MKKSVSIEVCVEEFALGVIKHAEYMFTATDPAFANHWYKAYMKALRKLNSLGDVGLSALGCLLKDKRDIVRVMAACYLVRVETDKALVVLQEAVNGRGWSATLAMVTLEKWRRGIYLDPNTGYDTKIG